MKKLHEEEDAALEAETTGDGESNEPESMTLTAIGRGDAPADLDYSSLGEGSKVFNKSTLLIVAILVVAAGSLYAMRMTQGDTSVSEEQKKSEARVEQLMSQLKSPAGLSADHPLKKGLADTETILQVLDHNPSQRQVPVEFTKFNPFVLIVEQPKEQPVKPTEDEAALRRAERMKKLDAEFAAFKLQSVVPTGRKPVAIINNKIVQLGEEIGSFKVKEIQNVTVTLEAEGKEFTLSLESDPNKPGGKRK